MVIDGQGVPVARAVEWLRPIADDDTRRLERWCAAVGPVVFDARPRTAGRAQGARETGRLAIVGWNVHVGGADVAAFVRGLEQGRFTDGEPQSQYVLLLQEVFRAGPAVPHHPPAGAPVPRRIAPRHPPAHARRDIVGIARALELHLFYAPSMRNGRDREAPDEDRGNAILSTLPLRDPKVVELPFERQRRVAVTAVIEWPQADGSADDLRLASAHLDNLASARRLWLGASGARARQARGLVQALAADRHVVLAGDFNTWGGTDEPAYRILAEHFDAAGDDPRPTFLRGTRMDYLFSRLPPQIGLAQRRLDDRFGSDHHPLVALLRRAKM